MTLRTALALLALVAAADTDVASAQDAPRGRRGGQAFTIEAAGGTLGSAAGVGLGLLAARGVVGACGVDDLKCDIQHIAFAGVGSSLGAAAGTMLAGHLADTEPSTNGALLGAFVGAAAGAGMIQILQRFNMHGRVPTIVSYSLVQGVVTAIGSRAFRER